MEENKKAILISIDMREKDFEKQIKEMYLLAENIGLDIVHETVQKREYPDPKFYLGKGKFYETCDFIKASEFDAVIFNDKITPAQRKTIEKYVKVPFYDRNEIILEIFVRNASSAESKLQVELAKLQYELPKLTGQGINLSRTGGNTGTLGGAGETQLEYNRRTINNRIDTLKKELKIMKEKRDEKNKRRVNSPLPLVSIVGYTSAGKSTLLKTSSEDENILVSPKLFSTLSTLSRKVKFPSGLQSVFSDTVGFIRKLPHELIESFKSTLEETTYGDVILEIIDISEDDYEDKMHVVEKTTEEIIKGSIPVIKVFNKTDLVSEDKLTEVKILYPDALFLSASDKESVNCFLKDLEKRMTDMEIIVSKKIELKFENMWKIEKHRENIGISEEITTDTGVSYTVVAKSQYINSTDL